MWAQVPALVRGIPFPASLWCAPSKGLSREKRWSACSWGHSSPAAELSHVCSCTRILPIFQLLHGISGRLSRLGHVLVPSHSAPLPPQIRGLPQLLVPLSAWTWVQVPLGGTAQAPREVGRCPGVARRGSGSPCEPLQSRQQHAWAAGGHPARSAAVPERVLQEAVLVSPLRPPQEAEGLGCRT